MPTPQLSFHIKEREWGGMMNIIKGLKFVRNLVHIRFDHFYEAFEHFSEVAPPGAVKYGRSDGTKEV